MSNPNEKPGIDERYTRATNATSLVVTAERAGAGDVLIAAGWAKSRVGSALLRLASEWDASEKPLRPKSDKVSADELARWFEHENKILMGKLKTLPQVREQIALWAANKGTRDANDKAGTALLWWLDPNCKACHGRRFETVKDTPTLSGRNCPACRGSGHRPMRGGVEIPVLLGYIDDCCNAARDQMKKRLRQLQ